MSRAFVGRQPIYDAQLDVFAYELLFRSGTENRSAVRDGDAATSTLLCNALLEIGLTNLAGERPVFINFTRSFITGRYPMPVDKDRLYIEVLEDIEIDDEVLFSIRKLVDEGYKIALDDFVFEDRLSPLVSIAHIVKLDFRAHDREAFRQQVQKLRRFPVKLLAEKIETVAEYEFCKELGFDYFQGYFLSRPSVIGGRRVPSSQSSILRLLSKLHSPDVGFGELAKIVCDDVTLSVKLLQYINSASSGLRRKVESIQQALTLLGLQRLRQLVTLLMLAQVEDKPESIVTCALVRAKMCELLASALQRSDRDAFFTVGLLSGLDALMDRPLEELLKDLPLADSVKGALLHHEGAMGAALHCTLAYERAEWDAVYCLTLDLPRVHEVYWQAIRAVEGPQGMAAELLQLAKPGSVRSSSANRAKALAGR